MDHHEFRWHCGRKTEKILRESWTSWMCIPLYLAKKFPQLQMESTYGTYTDLWDLWSFGPVRMHTALSHMLSLLLCKTDPCLLSMENLSCRSVFSMQFQCRSTADPTSALNLHLIIFANCYHSRTINRTGWDDSLPNPKCYGEIGSTGDCYQPGLPTILMVAKAKVTPPI